VSALTTFEADRGEWPEPILIPDRPPVPSLSPDMVPAPLRSWLEDQAMLACLPLEMFAVPAMIGISAVVGRAVGIRPGRFDDHVVVPNLWGAVVAPSGSMKSFAVAQGLKPVKQLAARSDDKQQGDNAKAEARRNRVEAEVSAIQEQMRKAAKQNEDLTALEAELTAKLCEREGAGPAGRRYLTQDSTTEKLGELMARSENSRGMLLFRDELAGWLRTMDRQDRAGDREFYLEAWNGDSDFRVDRIGRGSLYISGMTLAIVGGVQPGKLRSYVDEACGDGHGADGLLQRFQLLVWPDGIGTWKAPDRWADSQARTQAYDVYQRLDSLQPVDVGAYAVDDKNRAVPYLMFSPEAQVDFDSWREGLEKRLRGGQLDHAPAFKASVAKQRSLVPTLALLSNLIDWAATGASGPVPQAPVHDAIRWAEFLEAHARKVYATELLPGVEAARSLQTKIQAGRIRDGCSVRDIYRHGWAGLASPAQVAAGLDVLEAHGWVRVEAVETGGAPSATVRVHPKL
jgi:hypothetical protein